MSFKSADIWKYFRIVTIDWISSYDSVTKTYGTVVTWTYDINSQDKQLIKSYAVILLWLFKFGHRKVC